MIPGTPLFRLLPCEASKGAFRGIKLTMNLPLEFRLRWSLFVQAVVGAALLVLSAPYLVQAQSASKSLPPRVDLRPQLVPGQVSRYQIQLQTTTDTRRLGAIQDPQGPSQVVVTWDAIVRLELVHPPQPASAAPAPKPSSSQTRANGKAPVPAPLQIRTVYEKSVATVASDSPDPNEEDIEKQYANLEGRTIEFTLSPDGHVSDVHGLESILEGDQAVQAAQQWVQQISGLTQTPAAVSTGQSWTSQQPATSVPLAGMVWRTSSTYVRNESCRPADPAAGQGAASPPVALAAPQSPSVGTCAVILTRQTVLPEHQLKDPTPEDYRRNGLKTTGTWTGSGESLSYVSLQNGWAVSVTQDGTQQMDFTVTNSTGSSVRYTGTVQTRSRLSLLP